MTWFMNTGAPMFTISMENMMASEATTLSVSIGKVLQENIRDPWVSGHDKRAQLEGPLTQCL